MNQLQLTTTQLRYLTASHKHATLKEAADELGVSQSALSQGLAELERRVGLTLFTKQNRSLELDPNVRPVFDFASEIVSQTDQLQDWIESYKGAESGQLKIGAIDTAATVYFSKHIKAFMNNSHDVEFSLSVKPSAQLETALLDGSINAAIMVEPENKPDGIDYTKLLAEEIAIYAPPGANTRNSASWGPWVCFPKGSHTRKLISASLAKDGIPFEVVAESHQPEVLTEMVRMGLGWAALPASQAESQKNKVNRVRKKPLCSRNLVLATKSANIPSPALEAFIHSLLKTSPKTR